MHFLALDIGGANIKVADGRGYARSYPFPLWQKPQSLAHELRMAIAEAPPSVHLAVTMTGELADCFTSKAEGVKFILEALQTASDNRHTRVYLSDGRLVTPQVALLSPHLAAASNWHALARFAGRLAPRETALLCDLGSTTCDLIPLLAGRPTPRGTSDTTRLLSGELVYVGVERTPLCALLADTPYRGQRCPIARELFATTYDAFLLLDQLPENPLDMRTADGRPATKRQARERLGRMLAADEQEFNHRDAVQLAEAAVQALVDLIATAARRVIEHLPQPPQTLLFSGQGEFLAPRLAEQLAPGARVVHFTRELDGNCSRCAPAHALAVLAREAHGA